jgi:hypothetical protein
MKHMGLLKPTTNLQELADDLSLRFSQLYAARSQPPPTTTAAAAGPATAVAARSAAKTGTASTLLQRAGAIGFAEFAGVIAALALKYRFELPPYFTLIIRSLTTLEGFALVVDPSARYSIARTAVKVRDLAPYMASEPYMAVSVQLQVHADGGCIAADQC